MSEALDYRTRARLVELSQSISDQLETLPMALRLDMLEALTCGVIMGPLSDEIIPPERARAVMAPIWRQLVCALELERDRIRLRHWQTAPSREEGS